MAITLNGTTGITAPGLETFGDGTALGGATNPIVSMAKGANNYVQGYIVNNTDGANASADLVCYPSNGTDSSGWIDMGITGPTFSQAAYGITGANEGYIFMSAPSGASKTGNLVLATDSTGTQNAIKFATGGFGSTTERMRIDSSGKVGVGLTTLHAYLSAKVDGVGGANNNSVGVSVGIDGVGTTQSVSGWRFTGTNFTGIYGGNYAIQWVTDSANALSTEIVNTGATPIVFGTSATERARIDSNGNLLVGTTTQLNSAKQTLSFATGNNGLVYNMSDNVSGVDFAIFRANGAVCGTISRVGTTSAVLYVTSSDYRLKENIAPMTGALDKVLDLKPVTYDWKSGGSSQGFIAHELQDVVPDAVVGEKDAVDEEGNPRYQGIDTSFLVATLTAAIQELNAKFEEYKAAHP